MPVLEVDVAVGGTGVGVGGIGVAVGGAGVCVGNIGVAIGGTGVGVTSTGSLVGVASTGVGAGVHAVGSKIIPSVTSKMHGLFLAIEKPPFHRSPDFGQCSISEHIQCRGQRLKGNCSKSSLVWTVAGMG